MKSLDCLHYLVGMFIRLHLMPDLAHNAIFIDQERLTVDAYVLLSIQVLLSINTVELRNGCLCIGEQGKGQAVLFREFLMRVHTIGTDTKYHNTAFLHLMIGVTEAASLFRTAWCIILWIEIQNYCTPFKLLQMDVTVLHNIVASDRRKRKIRSRFLLFDLCITHNKSPLKT